MFIRISSETPNDDSKVMVDVCPTPYMKSGQRCSGLEKSTREEVDQPLLDFNEGPTLANVNIPYYSCEIDVKKQSLLSSLENIRLNLTCGGNEAKHNESYHPALTDIYNCAGGRTYRAYMSSREKNYMIDTFESTQSFLNVLNNNGFRELKNSEIEEILYPRTGLEIPPLTLP